MEEKIRTKQNISEGRKNYIIFVFESGIREIYDISYHKKLTSLEDVRKLCKKVGTDYNGNHPDPPPLLASKSTKCPTCGSDYNNKNEELEKREKEIENREKELDKEIKKIRSKKKKKTKRSTK